MQNPDNQKINKIIQSDMQNNFRNFLQDPYQKNNYSPLSPIFGQTYANANTNTNSFTDGESKIESNYLVWQPEWIEIQNPEKYASALKICPACGKLVSDFNNGAVCQSSQGLFYLAHAACIARINNFTEYTQTAKKQTKNKYLVQSNHKNKNKQHLMQLSIEHPLTPTKFYSSARNVLEQASRISFLIQNEQNQSFQPNIVVLPLLQFKITIKTKSIQPSNKKQPKPICFRVDLKQQKQGPIQLFITEQNHTVYVEFQVLKSTAHKQKIIQQMNYKYNRPYQKQNFVKFNKLVIQLTDQQNQFSSRTSKSISKSRDKKQHEYTREEACENPRQYKTFVIPAILSPSQITYSYGYQYSHSHSLNHSHPHHSHSNPHFDSHYEQPEHTFEKPSSSTNLPESQFIANIKTQSGSKQFQKKCKSYKVEEIQQILTKVLPCIEQIVISQYANYMFQSLISVCTFQQRLKILSIIKQKSLLPKLVCQKEGTFVFQQLLSFLTALQQFQLICSSISGSNFLKIALDGYGNHFLRKLLQVLPKDPSSITIMLLEWMPTIEQNFQNLGRNRNAVCVLKCVLRFLKQRAKTSKEAAAHLKKFLQTLMFNMKQLINDEYGNYLIQEAYDLIYMDNEWSLQNKESYLQKLEGINELIVNFFALYSCQKYSNNVISLCIKKYWSPKRPQSMKNYQTLNKNLHKKQIQSMYENKDGNRILLQLMQLPFDLTLKDKIQITLHSLPMSKFNNSKWTTIYRSKSRTGNIGTQFDSFSEAVRFDAFGKNKGKAKIQKTEQGQKNKSQKNQGKIS